MKLAVIGNEREDLEGKTYERVAYQRIVVGYHIEKKPQKVQMLTMSDEPVRDWEAPKVDRPSLYPNRSHRSGKTEGNCPCLHEYVQNARREPPITDAAQAPKAGRCGAHAACEDPTWWWRSSAPPRIETAAGKCAMDAADRKRKRAKRVIVGTAASSSVKRAERAQMAKVSKSARHRARTRVCL